MINSVLLVRPFAGEKKEFPLGILYVGTVLKQHGYKVQIIDLHDTPEREDEIIDIVKRSPTIMLGISALAHYYRWVKQITKRVKQASPSTKIIVGGHIAISYQVLMDHAPIDFICVGEGEETLPDLIDAINTNRSLDQVAGIVYRNDDGTIVRTKWRKLLEVFPQPDYSLIDVTRYLIHPNQDHFFRRSLEYQRRARPNDRLAVIMFSRGCIGSCGFCYRHLPGYRQASTDWCWQHMKGLYDTYNIHYFRIDDELFTNNFEWFKALHDRIKDAKIDILFRVTGLRVDTITDEQLQMLKEIGCIAINYGIESCSQDILNEMSKRVTVEQNVTALTKTLAHGLQTMAYIILGYVGDTHASIRRTIHTLLNCNLNPESVSTFYLTALPGTKVYRDAISHGQITNEDTYLESLYDLIVTPLGLHKRYLINFTNGLSAIDIVKYDQELSFLLRLRKRLGSYNAIVKGAEFVMNRLPAPILLPILATFARIRRMFI